MDNKPYLSNLWKWKCNMPEEVIANGLIHPSLEELRRTEWSNEFETLMRNRLIQGSFRYGRLGTSNKPKYDRVTDIIRRVELYRETGNLELLVDVANLSLAEFVEGNHPKKHMESIDDGIHTQTIK